MCFFENDYFLAILKTYKEITFPMLVPVIVKLADTHWHTYINIYIYIYIYSILQESLIALKTILKEIDPYAFEEALNLDPSKRYIYLLYIYVLGRNFELSKTQTRERRWMTNGAG